MGLNILAWVKAKKYTDNAVSQSAGLHREIVTSLPITGDDKVIYMVPITGSGDDNYNEYMWINGTYELIGNTRVDLTDYYNKTQVDAALSGKANTATSLSGYGITDAYTKTEVDSALSGKQSALTFDNVPTANSDNPTKSKGIKSYVDETIKVFNFLETISRSIPTGDSELSFSASPSGYNLVGIGSLYLGGVDSSKLTLNGTYQDSYSGFTVYVRNNTGSAITPSGTSLWVKCTLICAKHYAGRDSL